jgi:hypothetical protein
MTDHDKEFILACKYPLTTLSTKSVTGSTSKIHIYDPVGAM